MQTVFTIVALLILAIIAFAVYRLIKIRKQSGVLNQARFERIKPLYEKLENDESLTAAEILPYAEDFLTRELTYQLLQNHQKTELFPAAFYTIIKAAESNLANWLEFPTELGAAPDEIEHIQRVTFDFNTEQRFIHYEIFRYRVNEPHWAAKNGWIMGVVGPYFNDSKPYDFPRSTFSRIGIESSVEQSTPEKEAKWVHENITMRRR